MIRCPCGFPRDVCWRCNPPPDVTDGWRDAIKDMEEDAGQTQPKQEFLDHERDREDKPHRLGGD